MLAPFVKVAVRLFGAEVAIEGARYFLGETVGEFSTRLLQSLEGLVHSKLSATLLANGEPQPREKVIDIGVASELLSANLVIVIGPVGANGGHEPLAK